MMTVNENVELRKKWATSQFDYKQISVLSCDRTSKYDEI